MQHSYTAGSWKSVHGSQATASVITESNWTIPSMVQQSQNRQPLVRVHLLEGRSRGPMFDVCIWLRRIAFTFILHSDEAFIWRRSLREPSATQNMMCIHRWGLSCQPWRCGTKRVALTVRTPHLGPGFMHISVNYSAPSCFTNATYDFNGRL